MAISLPDYNDGKIPEIVDSAYREQEIVDNRSIAEF